MHKVDDVLPDGRKIVEVDSSLKRFNDAGEVIAEGVEYKYTQGEEDTIRKFQEWTEVKNA